MKITRTLLGNIRLILSPDEANVVRLLCSPLATPQMATDERQIFATQLICHLGNSLRDILSR